MYSIVTYLSISNFEQGILSEDYIARNKDKSLCNYDQASTLAREQLKQGCAVVEVVLTNTHDILTTFM